MNWKSRVRIVSNGRVDRPGDTRVFIDGEDVSDTISRVEWTVGAKRDENLSWATITFIGAELDVEYVAERRESSA